jgi:hypothetical protein
MSTLSCRFCGHRNPPGAKFCSDCGSPLALKPCPKCEAITDVGAECCHQCGAPFDMAVATDAVAEAASPIQQASDIDERAGAVGVPVEGAHVPESLADRLGGTVTPRPHDEKVEPQVPPSPEGRFDVAEADDDPPIGLRSHAFAPAPRPFRWATLALALIAIGVAGYYVYAGRMSDVPQDADVALVGKDTPPSAPPAGSNPPSAAQQSAATKSPAEPVQSPAEPVQPQSESVSPQPESMQSRAETVKAQRESTVRTRKPQDHAALATQRLIARDLRSDADAPGAPATQLDKDAIATQRLIERELGPFLPDKANGTSRDAPAAIN